MCCWMLLISLPCALWQLMHMQEQLLLLFLLKNIFLLLLLPTEMLLILLSKVSSWSSLFWVLFRESIMTPPSLDWFPFDEWLNGMFLMGDMTDLHWLQMFVVFWEEDEFWFFWLEDPYNLSFYNRKISFVNCSFSIKNLSCIDLTSIPWLLVRSLSSCLSFDTSAPSCSSLRFSCASNLSFSPWILWT